MNYKIQVRIRNYTNYWYKEFFLKKVSKNHWNIVIIYRNCDNKKQSVSVSFANYYLYIEIAIAKKKEKKNQQ